MTDLEVTGTEPETGITPGGRDGAFKDVLAADHARRGKPPRHFTDMDEQERQEVCTGMGLPKFRVSQLANHYFNHLSTDPADFTDFPAASRAEAAQRFFPELITPVTVQEADRGTTIKTRWELFDGSRIESVLMR